MNGFIRKAISLFVVLDEEQSSGAAVEETTNTQSKVGREETVQPVVVRESDLSKFEKHFQDLFDKANLPGPDYYEFWKMMDTLEAHIPNEAARMQAVFDALKVQGLTREKLVQTAMQYRELVVSDRNNFEAVVHKKVAAEIEGRNAKIQQLANDAAEKEALIARLQSEIEAARKQVLQLQEEVKTEQEKIDSASNGYLAACQAMIAKLERDADTFTRMFS